ncbi:N-acetyltransferase [Hafnia alvei]|uniref:N-acetyltransferase domain-containing protein n=1 Tax=Hafnia alvei TaxID=569 RepID=A0A172X0M0_HAFAL|nr:GNAT family N-acetyltransferase [Hafnia alvei]ANF30103.1 hypothetical protein [Hafnia alvei]TBL43376.1 N-acetyltransferase [Hafnia alvei]
MKLQSKTIKLVPVEATKHDALKIIELRGGNKQSEFLSKTSQDINAQVEWLKSYLMRNSQGLEYYFFIVRLDDDDKIGTIRLYDIQKNIDSFCWGSWLLNERKTRSAALESCLLIYTFGFEKLGFENSHFDVRKGNEKVINFHLKSGAMIIGEDEQNYYFKYNMSSFIKFKNKYLGALK